MYALSAAGADTATALTPLASHPHVKHLRQKGMIAAFDVTTHDPAFSRKFYRAALAREFGATHVVAERDEAGAAAVKALTDGIGADVVIEGSGNPNAVPEGLKLARQLLVDINEMGMPTATEFLDMVTGQYISDLITWGAIGARTTESQVHREMASALSCPVGFKNGTDGNTRIAIDAVRAARHSHIFYSPDKDGKMTIYRTAGNPYGHVILRGGHRPNYDTASIDEACEALADVGLPERLVVDFSHGNSMKDHRRQLLVAQDICDQLRRGRTGIAGIMAESFLVEGRQDVENGCAVTFGQSITDACINWDDTDTILRQLANAVKARRG